MLQEADGRNINLFLKFLVPATRIRKHFLHMLVNVNGPVKQWTHRSLFMDLVTAATPLNALKR
jgi:hypothetical protein